MNMLGGMMLGGIGAGVLNSAVVEVEITTIPPARAGMASGMSGTIRFSGLVIGFAALGAILVSRISSIVAGDPSSGRPIDAAEFVRNLAAGSLAGGLNADPGWRDCASSHSAALAVDTRPSYSRRPHLRWRHRAVLDSDPSA